MKSNDRNVKIYIDYISDDKYFFRIIRINMLCQIKKKI